MDYDIAKMYYNIKNYKMALKFYNKNIEICVDKEMKFNSYLDMSKISLMMELDFHTSSLIYLTKALETCPKRAEPYILLSSWYYDKNELDIANFYIKHACSLDIPKDLKYDKYLYNSFRWELKKKICRLINDKKNKKKERV